MTEGKLQEDAAKATRAKLLMEELAQPFAELEAAYIKLWRESPARDAIGREKLFIAVNVVGKVKEHLQSTIATAGLPRKSAQALA